MSARADHLAWCKGRALALLESGDEAGAIASMASDLGKAETPPLYDGEALQLLLADGLLMRRGPDQVRTWIEGFA